MRTSIKLTFYLLFAGLVSLVSCKKENLPNRLPVANAGTDRRIDLPGKGELNGSGSSDPDNNIASYKWTKISGPSSFKIVNADVAQTLVEDLVQGIYQFELKVTDADGLFSKDTMMISGRELTFDNLTWENNAAEKYVYMQAPPMPNGYSADGITNVLLLFYVFNSPSNWSVISRGGNDINEFHYKINNNSITVYNYYDTYCPTITQNWLYVVSNQVKVIFPYK
jgi:hypothetical protein